MAAGVDPENICAIDRSTRQLAARHYERVAGGRLALRSAASVAALSLTLNGACGSGSRADKSSSTTVAIVRQSVMVPPPAGFALSNRPRPHSEPLDQAK